MFVQNFDENHDEDFTKIGTITCANLQQLTRSAFPAMQQTATDILRYHRAKEVDDRLMSIKDIITLVDEV